MQYPLKGRVTNGCKKFKFWNFWERPIFEIWEYAFNLTGARKVVFQSRKEIDCTSLFLCQVLYMTLTHIGSVKYNVIDVVINRQTQQQIAGHRAVRFMPDCRRKLTLPCPWVWWGRCEKKLSPEGGRKGGWRKKCAQCARWARGLNPGPAAC